MKIELVDSFDFWWKSRNDGTLLTRWKCRCLIKHLRKRELNPWLEEKE